MGQQQSDRERQLKARITELAAGLLHAIGGGGSLHEVPRQIEEAAHAIRAHGDTGDSAVKLIAQALNIEDAHVIAKRFRSILAFEDHERDCIESVQEYSLEAIRTGAVREAAAMLEGNKVKRNRARQQMLFGVNALIDARKLSLEFFGQEGRRQH
jgi:hypothetical protein